jgi:flagellar basal-body rod modification protein FlgD
MTVTATGSSTAASSTTSATALPKKAFDSEMFLNLLVTQLRSQDPGSPMDTNAMIAQTTQLASMEQLTSLTATSNDAFALQARTAAASIIGKDVSWVENGATKSGVATSVSFLGTTPTVKVGTSEIPLHQLVGMGAAQA